MDKKDQDKKPPEPLDSATVVLLREAESPGFEVYLMRRARKQSFMGGAYVFPGGKLDSRDCDPALAGHSPGLAPEQAVRRLQEEELDPHTALGLHLCALREMFEEAGVLLARDENGNTVGLASLDPERILSLRKRLHRGEIGLHEVADKAGVTLAPELTAPWSHWITPFIEKKRFNTRFFIARMPAGQEASHDDVELRESLWLAPGEAIDKHYGGEIVLMPPTLKTLEELSAHESIDSVFEAASSRPIYPILPQAFRFEGGFGVMLPHDPEYELEGYKQPPRPGETSRVVMRDGKWRAEKA